MNKRISPILAFGIIIGLVILVAGAFQLVKNDSDSAELPGINNPKQCTMEAKLCPGGSAVGRSGPNCEFAECPIENNNCIGEGKKFWTRTQRPDSKQCCAGLSEITTGRLDEAYCTKCGDGICKNPETAIGCPVDCK
ncbi:hypothetical protein ACFLY1_00275 [Patescibacteria group bacterium]